MMTFSFLNEKGNIYKTHVPGSPGLVRYIVYALKSRQIVHCANALFVLATKAGQHWPK